jgi:hypothetical protein
MVKERKSMSSRHASFVRDSRKVRYGSREESANAEGGVVLTPRASVYNCVLIVLAGFAGPVLRHEKWVATDVDEGRYGHGRGRPSGSGVQLDGSRDPRTRKWLVLGE